MLLRLTTDELSGDRWTAAIGGVGGTEGPVLEPAELVDGVRLNFGDSGRRFWAGLCVGSECGGGRCACFGLRGRTLSESDMSLRTASGDSAPARTRPVHDLSQGCSNFQVPAASHSSPCEREVNSGRWDQTPCKVQTHCRHPLRVAVKHRKLETWCIETQSPNFKCNCAVGLKFYYCDNLAFSLSSKYSAYSMQWLNQEPVKHLLNFSQRVAVRQCEKGC